jgi:hypothetical protein
MSAITNVCNLEIKKNRSNRNKTIFSIIFTLCVLCTEVLFMQTSMNVKNMLKFKLKNLNLNRFAPKFFFCVHRTRM